MVLSEQDKEWVKMVAKDLAFEAVKEVLREHIESCPYGKKLIAYRAFLIGVGVGLTLISSSIGFGLAKLLSI